jgi:hypothetical protein
MNQNINCSYIRIQLIIQSLKNIGLLRVTKFIFVFSEKINNMLKWTTFEGSQRKNELMIWPKNEHLISKT